MKRVEGEGEALGVDVGEGTGAADEDFMLAGSSVGNYCTLYGWQRCTKAGRMK